MLRLVDLSDLEVESTTKALETVKNIPKPAPSRDAANRIIHKLENIENIARPKLESNSEIRNNGFLPNDSAR